MTPRTTGDVSAEWLGDVLGCTVTDIDLQPIAAGQGFMGQLARVTITSPDAHAPRSVIVKVPNPDPAAQFLGQVMRTWEREHGFYRDAARHMSVRVPIAYVNVGDPPCFVFEDLAPATPGDHVAGATLDQAERAIDLLARHHAAWWEHPLLRTFSWMPGLDDPMIHSLKPTFDMGWPTFLERYSGDLPARAIRWCEQFVEEIVPWVGRHLDDQITMTHGDFRLDNIFFDDGPGGTGEVSLIDWQNAMRSPAGSDLVYFCANNLTVEMRRAHERDLIARYLDGLRSHGVPIDALTDEEAWHGYREGLLFYALSFGGSILTLNPANERGAALLDALVRRTFTAVDDLDAGHVLGYTG